MKYLNRHAFVLKPLQPLIEWVKSLPEPYNFSEEAIEEQDFNVYLTDEFSEPEDMDRFLKKHCKELFHENLSEWHTDESAFPELTYKNFRKWFSVEECTAVCDLSTRQLEYE
jgi:hypothetical protein